MSGQLPPEIQRRIDEAVHQAKDRLQRFDNRLRWLERRTPRILPPGEEAAEERRQESLARWEAVRRQQRGQ